MHQTGEVLHGRYRIDGVLGRGGMGGVYQAHFLSLEADVAVKEMTLEIHDSAEKESAVRQFKKEAKILHDLHHNGLPRVHDFFEDDGRYYLVMDLVKGRTLEQVVDKSPVTESQVLDWARQIGEVLQFLHAQEPPIIFRDLKPSNIMLTDDDHIKLIDFGIAKSFDRQTGLGTQTTSAGAGSPGFAAPEQYGRGTDIRTDVYALGATLYSLLARRVPPQSVDIASGSEKVVPLREIRPDVSEQTEKAITWMMQVNRDLRPPLVADAIKALGGGTVPTLTPAASGRLTSSTGPLAEQPHVVQRWLMPLAIIAILFLGAVAFAAYGLMSKTPPSAAAKAIKVHITSKPSGAALTVRTGERVGTTPADVSVLPGNDLAVSLHLDGYKDKSEVITPSTEGQSFPFTLDPADVTVTFRVTPDRARMQIDGKGWVDNVGGRDLPRELSPGKHQIEIEAANYDAKVQSVDVKPGMAAINLTLKPHPAKLTVEGPPGATVSIDDKPRGAVPVSLQLEPGDHQVHVSKASYQDVDRVVTLDPGQTRTLPIEMQSNTVVVAPPPPPPAQNRPPPRSGLERWEVVPGVSFGNINLGSTKAAEVARELGISELDHNSETTIYGSFPGGMMAGKAGNVEFVGFGPNNRFTAVANGITYGSTQGDVERVFHEPPSGGGKPFQERVLQAGFLVYPDIAFHIENGRVNWIGIARTRMLFFVAANAYIMGHLPKPGPNPTPQSNRPKRPGGHR